MKHMRKILAATLLYAATTLTASASEKLDVMLEWFVNPDHAPLVVAQELGLFEKQDLQVNLIAPADPSSSPRLVAAKQADIAVHYQPNLYLDHAQGLPLVRFGVLVETPLNTITVLKDGPIQSLADLKGKKIGFSVSGFEQTLVSAMLASVDLKNDDVELINVNFALSPSLISGQVDATIGGFRNFELTQIKLEGHEGRSFFVEEHGVPPYEELIYVTHKDNAQDTRLPRFLSALEEATIYLTNHPQESWSLFINAYPDLDNELNRQAWIDTLPRFAKRPAAIDEASYERFGAFMKDHGQIETVPAVGDIAIRVN